MRSIGRELGLRELRARSGGTSVTNRMPEFTPPPPKPPTTAERRASPRAACCTNASARWNSASVSSRSEPTAVCRRIIRRLWSCDGTNSLGSCLKTKIDADEHERRARRAPTSGRRRPRASTQRVAALEACRSRGRRSGRPGCAARATVVEHLRAARRRQRDRLDVREQHRDAERHAELEEELADDALHEDDRQEDRDRPPASRPARRR